METSFSLTPIIPQSIYSSLPNFLLRAVEVYECGSRERDVLFTSLLPAIGGSLFEVSGIYRNQKTYSTLYSFVVAPPASGKGSAINAKHLVMPLNKFFQRDNSEDLVRLLVPGDISAAKMLDMLKSNQGRGIMIESEADTLSNSLKQEWGNMSDKLRANWHHEPISFARKQNNEYHEIDTPRMSMALAGTPNQVKQLIPGTANGLFSRFLFYAFDQPALWDDFSNERGLLDIKVTMEDLGKELIAIHEFYKQTRINFQLSSEQLDHFNNHFRAIMPQMLETHGEFSSGIVKRMGLATFRMAMIFSALRRWENKMVGSDLICTDADFNSAVQLSSIYLKHAQAILEIMPDTGLEIKKRRLESFYSKLPNGEFCRENVNTVGEELSIPTRTRTKYIDELLKLKKICRLEHNKYKKV